MVQREEHLAGYMLDPWAKAWLRTDLVGSAEVPPPPMLHRVQPSPAGPLAMPQALRPHCEALYPLCPLPGTGFLQNLSPLSSQA